MNWYWKVRIYNRTGHYAHAYIETSRNIKEIDIIQDFYFALTGCKMLLEGMSETQPPEPFTPGNQPFYTIFKDYTP